MLEGLPAAPTASEGPADSRPSFSPDSWETWWGHHEAAILRLRARFDALRVRTPAEVPAGPRIPEAIVAGRIVPALLAELARNPGAERTSSALIALARLGPRTLPGTRGTTVRLLGEYLGHERRSVVESACLALGIVGDLEAVPQLVSLLRDDDPARARLGRGRVPEALRTSAAYALGVAVDALDHPDVARYAAYELLALWDRGEGSLDLRVALVIALGECSAGQPLSALTARLLACLRDDRQAEVVRSQAATSLGELHAEGPEEARLEVVSSLLEVLAAGRSTGASVRQGVVLALGRLVRAGDEPCDVAARVALCKAAETGDRSARAFALLALAECASRAPRMRGETAPLAEPSHELESFLRSMMLSSKGSLRAWAALALGVHGYELGRRNEALQEASRGALARLLGQERTAEGAAALSLAAGLGGASGALQALLERQERERDPGYAALALGLLHHAAALDALRAETGRADHDALRLARVGTARALLGDTELVADLVQRLTRAECDRACIALSDVLGTLGDARAVEPLIAQLEAGSSSDRRRAWAAFALGRLAERRELPWISLYALRVNYLAAPPSLSSPFGGGLLELR